MRKLSAFSIAFVALFFLAGTTMAHPYLSCTLTNQKDLKKSVSIDLELDPTQEELTQSSMGLGVKGAGGKKLDYSFDVSLTKEGKNYVASVFFYENITVQDEVGSASFEFNRATPKQDKKVYTETVEDSDLKVKLKFECIQKAATAAHADAQIKAIDPNDKWISVALDNEGTPRVSSDLKKYPTIKDFGDGASYTDSCYEGKSKDVRKLLTALVDAANGDGDSWASLNSIKFKSKIYWVEVQLTDEGGENTEEYGFTPCE